MRRRLSSKTVAGLEARLGPEAEPAATPARNSSVAARPAIERSALPRLQRDPGRVSVDSVVTEVAKLPQIRQLGFPIDLFATVSPKLLKHYQERVAVEPPRELRRHPDVVRYTLLAAFCSLRSQEIAEAIHDAVKIYGVRVIGVIPYQSISSDFDQTTVGHFRKDGGRDVIASTRLRRVIKVLYGKDANPQKLTFLFSSLQKQPDSQGSIYQYVHSKVFIMDDAFCTIGSMNFNRRSTTHDSELSLGFYEPNPTADGFAKRLRLRLWQQYLGLFASEQHLIDDPLESIAKVWSRIGSSLGEIKSPGGARWRPSVVRYDWSGDKPLGTREHFIDPVGIGISDETEFVDKVTDPVVTSDETKRVPSR
jgi:hypothetical protein